jgi:hypothetical protein
VLTHAAAAYLRAEADVLDASRKDDLANRRLALEKRAKVGIDGEMAMLQGERDAKALLTVDQRATLQAIGDQAASEPRPMQRPLWAPLVAPPSVTFRFGDWIVRDSGQVRLKVTPSYAEIFIDGVNVGTNFKQVSWPIGDHTVRFQAPGCGNPIEQQFTLRKGQLLIIPPVTIAGC